MIDILEKSRLVAQSRKPVHIIGEHGSGKKHLATIIHKSSDRKDYKLSRINCYALPSEEVKEKLFGYISSTNQSVHVNRGMFEASDNGTIFIEGFEVLPADLQLRTIESIYTRTFSHIGSTSRIKSDVRLITSTYKRVMMHNDSSYSANNYIYEVNPLILFLPPLRNRREDIAPLVYNFFNSAYLTNDTTLQFDVLPEVLYHCLHYNWPGNIKQLKNAFIQAALCSGGKDISINYLPKSIQKGLPGDKQIKEIENSSSFRTAEKNLIHDLLTESNSLRLIATRLGISLSSVEGKVLQYQLMSVN
ncbi:MAG: sigma 54-interacting transcriptional regulator [Balneolales bacterium]